MAERLGLRQGAKRSDTVIVGLAGVPTLAWLVVAGRLVDLERE